MIQEITTTQSDNGPVMAAGSNNHDSVKVDYSWA